LDDFSFSNTTSHLNKSRICTEYYEPAIRILTEPDYGPYDGLGVDLYYRLRHALAIGHNAPLGLVCEGGVEHCTEVLECHKRRDE